MPDEEIKHRFPVDGEDKGNEFKFQPDSDNPEHSEHMAELFKEVSDSKPESIAEFLIRLNEINKIKH